MNEMVERLARTMQDRFSPDKPLDPAYVEEARFLLATIREPTKAMCDAGDEAVQSPTWQAQYVWPAMIDAALKDD